jgi:PAS domain S-box-containing protein
VVVPLRIGSGMLGALTFASARERGAWPETLVKRLQLVAQVIENAISRKRSEAQLQMSEARYRSLVETQTDIISRSDLEGRLTFVNGAYCRMFGVDRDEAVNHSFFPTVLPEDLPVSLAALKAVRVPPYRVATETRHRTPHGVRWISWENTGVVDGAGNVIELQGIGRDISDRKLAEASLRENEARLASAIDVAALGFYEQTGLRITFLDDRVRSLLGIPQDQDHFTFDYWKEHLHPDDQQRLLDIAQALLTGRLDGAAAEYRYQHPQHGMVWISHSTRVLDHNSAGEAVRLIGVMQDITERKRMEEALRTSEEVSRATFEQAAVGIAHVGIDGRWLRVNDRLCAIAGYSRDELMKLTFQDVTHPDDLETDLDYVRRVLSGEIKTYTMEKRYIRKDRSLTWINLTVSLVRTAAGEPKHFIAVVEDIDERKKAEEEMGRLQRQAWHAERVARTAAITASLAHELNQPLAAILSNAQAALHFLAGPSPDLAEIHEILEEIVHDNKRASAVITGLRAMLRREKTHHEVVRLGETIQEVLDLLHSEFVFRQVESRLRCEADGTVLADKAQIQQVILNLAMNAAEAVQVQPEDQRRIEVTVACPNPEEALVSVRDTGPGIPPEQTGKLFDAFWTTKAQGMGIGLPICRSIIEAHGGRIWLGNGQPGETTFCFILRVMTPAERAGRSVGQA